MYPPIEPIDKFAQEVRRVENLGFDYFWVAEEAWVRDIYSALALIAKNTKKITIGPGATNPYYRNIQLTAVSTLTIDELSGGRAAIMIGLGGFTSTLGIKVEKPVAAMREALRVLKQTFRGETDLAKYAKKYANINSRSEIPVILAGIGPQMFKMSQKEADGVELAHMPAEYLKFLIQNLLEKQGFRIGVQLLTFISENEEEAKMAARKYAKYIAGQAYKYPEVAESLSLSEADLKPFGVDFTKGVDKLTVDLAPDVQDEILRHFALIGTPDQILKQMKLYRNVGVTHLTITPMAFNRKFIFETVSKLKKEI
jgi:5,10-methylenetetrahydromethanopterin reductase